RQPGAGVGPHQLEDPGVRVPGDGFELVAFDLHWSLLLVGIRLDEGLEPGGQQVPPPLPIPLLGVRRDVAEGPVGEVEERTRAPILQAELGHAERDAQVEAAGELQGAARSMAVTMARSRPPPSGQYSVKAPPRRGSRVRPVARSFV